MAQKTIAHSIKDNLHILAGMICLVAFIILSFAQFTKECFTLNESNSKLRLEEFTEQSASAFNDKMISSQKYMQGLANTFANSDDLFSAESFEVLEAVVNSTTFYRMWIGDAVGNCYMTKDIGIFMDYKEYYPNIYNHKSGVSKLLVSPYDQMSAFCIYAPIIKDGELRGVLIGTYEAGGLSSSTEVSRFEGQGYTHVFQKSGDILIKSESANSMVKSNNLWQFFSVAKFPEGNSFMQIRANVENGGHGFATYDYDGQERIGYYAPLEINDWYLMTAVPRTVISSYSKPIDHIALMLIAKISICSVILMGMFVAYTKRTQKKIVQVNRLLEISNERFRIAASHNINAVVEYDIAADMLYPITKDIPNDDSPRKYYSISKENIVDSVIEKDYEAEFVDLVQKIRKGEKTVSCVIKSVNSEGASVWNRLIFTNIFDENNKPVRAIGTIEDITSQKEIEQRYASEEQHRLAMFAEAMATYVFSLTRGRFLYAHDNANASIPIEPQVEYNTELRRLSAGKVHIEDLQSFYQALSLESIKQAHKDGKRKIEIEYRRPNQNGDIKWINCSTNIVVNPVTGELLGYTYIKDITSRKMNELELLYNAERDNLTGLYNRSTAKKMIDQFLQERINSPHIGLHAFMIIDIDKFKGVNDTYGHTIGDELLIKIGARLLDIFRASDIVARLGGDEFIVFLKDARSEMQIKEKAQLICNELKEITLSADTQYRVSGSVGISFIPVHGSTEAELYRKSDLALYEAKNAGKDMYRVYEPAMEGVD